MKLIRGVADIHMATFKKLSDQPLAEEKMAAIKTLSI